MTETQMLTVLLATVPTILVVLISLLVSNARLSDLRDVRIEARFTSAGQHVIPGTWACALKRRPGKKAGRGEWI